MAISFRARAVLFDLQQAELASLEHALARATGTERQLPIDPHGRAVRGSRDEIRQFAEDIASLRSTYRSARIAELARERRIRGLTAALVEQAVEPLLARDPDLATLDRMVAFLDEVLASGAAPLVIEGD